MARTNVALKRPAVFTHEGAKAVSITPYEQLRRSVLATLLWEDQFYEDGIEIGTRIKQLAAQVTPRQLADLAVEARHVYKLRHVPLLLLTVLAQTGSGIPGLVADTVNAVVRRADEMAELLALYWKDGKKPISAQLRKGLARAFLKFDEYQLAKYNRDGAVKLRDVMFLARPRPQNKEQAKLFERVASNTLKTPDTWEVNLSAGADKNETFTRLINDGNLGYLALLRNLRNMVQAGVDDTLIKKAILDRKGAGVVLPFRYVAAARVVPQYERELDKALLAAIAEGDELSGRTIILVDVSGSMDARLSGKSDMTRADAAATLASMIKGETRVFSFSNRVVEVPPRLGMAGVDAILRSQPHGGTNLGLALEAINKLPHDRLIVITDEQSHDRVVAPVAEKAYMINVASYQNGVGYRNGWTHIDGWSEGVLRYISETEREADAKSAKLVASDAEKYEKAVAKQKRKPAIRRVKKAAPKKAATKKAAPKKKGLTRKKK